MNNIDKKSINTLRVLVADMIQKANSGHPGMPLGSAPALYTLFRKSMNYSVNNPDWINRDRFILSAGHASALQYSLLHLLGYNVSMEDLKQFRQVDSITPGHPEVGVTNGVEATTGPLGAGLSNAVGMAMAQEHLAKVFNRPGYDILDNFVFTLVGDGCLMEGITSEASSLAGNLKLGRLIVLFDSNNITIDGSTDISIAEDTRKRYESYGFETFLVEDGNDIEVLNKTIEKAKSNLNQPSFIEIKTTIGYGSNRAGTSSVHGAPLGEEGVVYLKEQLNMPTDKHFFVDEDVRENFKNISEAKEGAYTQWTDLVENYFKEYPELKELWDTYFKEIYLSELVNKKELLKHDSKDQATRNSSHEMINRFKEMYPQLIGGSADLASSNMTDMKGENIFSSEDYSGRNIRFGIREHAMAGIANGIALYGPLKPYVATFFVFSDFLKPMARLSALSNIPLTYVFTHDSIGVGEDGATHEPIEQLAMLRSMPNMITYRPADFTETSYGWMLAVTSKQTPVSLILSRQALPQLENTGKGALQGAYIVKDFDDAEAILMASGSEVSLAIESSKALETQGRKVRVVSVPSMELFRSQPKKYRDSVLDPKILARVAVEAASPQPWYEFVGLDGKTVTMDRFGLSGPGNELFEKFGFTVDNVTKVVMSLLDNE